MSIQPLTLLTLTGLAALPVSIVYMVTADYRTFTHGTIASNNVAQRFRLFEQRAKDSMPKDDEAQKAREMRRRREVIRERMAMELM
ncbi:hypothetical protein TI39_contig5855g00009 [Zymoseptoria brevis]|uniref:Uncharacterized protein n=1 Tax=Zymoseptoria brevis TaxID=1047168 RepID=A0A0F4G4Y6_9PEZI|nr:hypothetical protein TI39_contig5855g00009 [Zymoseptoria brevis]